MNMQKTAAIYARFSSDLQEDRSIEDQIEVCRVLAKRESLKIVTTFNDRAKSGSTLFDRGGLRDLETAAKERRFNVLIVESLDRLSRDQADLAYLFKRLEFAEIKILTSEGYATSMHVGIRGLVGSMFLKDLGDKVRRGLGGRARDGKVPGSVCYGYRRVPGRPGEREIVPEEVAVVQRIFTQYAAGRSPRAIAFDLSREGIPSPSGAKNWSHQVFTGSTLRHGMLGNRIYIGEIEWNKTRTVRNPQTGRRTKRAAPNDELIIASAPHLRIIDQALWDAAARVRQNRAIHQFGGDGTLGPREHSGRNEYLLAGLLRCGVCASHMRIAVKPRGESARVACAAAHQFGTCEHRRTYDLDKLQSGIFENMRSKLTDPKLIAEKAKAYHARYAEREKQNRSDAGSIRKRLDRVETQINRLGTAISESDESVPVLMARLRPLEAERVGLVECGDVAPEGAGYLLPERRAPAYRIDQ
jgi:site-specific DNA recombinase